jgi:hypothetical protein
VNTGRRRRKGYAEDAKKKEDKRKKKEERRKKFDLKLPHMSMVNDAAFPSIDARIGIFGFPSA